MMEQLVKLISRKFTALLFGGGVLLLMQRMHADVGSMTILAGGFAAGLTALIGGQALIDHAEMKKAP